MDLQPSSEFTKPVGTPLIDPEESIEVFHSKTYNSDSWRSSPKQIADIGEAMFFGDNDAPPHTEYVYTIRDGKFVKVKPEELADGNYDQLDVGLTTSSESTDFNVSMISPEDQQILRSFMEMKESDYDEPDSDGRTRYYNSTIGEAWKLEGEEKGYPLFVPRDFEKLKLLQVAFGARFKIPPKK